MNTAHFVGMKTLLKAIPAVKYVKLFKNQIEHSNRKEHADQDPVTYPCALIEYESADYKSLGVGGTFQQLDVGMVRIHIGFESYKEEDTAALDLKEAVINALINYENGNYGKLQLVKETPDKDFNNIQDYVVEFKFGGRRNNYVAPLTKKLDLDLSKPVIIPV